jgi:phosphohistidine swiveling domain-containing protein
MTKWVYEWEKPCAPFFPASFFHIYRTGDDFFGKAGHCLIAATGHRVTLFFGEETLNKLALEVRKKITSDKNFPDEFSKKTEQLINKMHESGKKATKQMKPQLFGQYWEAYWHNSLPVATIRYFNRIAIKECTEWLATKYKKPGEIAEALSILAGTSKTSFAQKEHKDFEKILSYVLKDKKVLDSKDEKLAKMIDEHLGRYQWFPCGYDNEIAWDKNHIMNELRDAVEEGDKFMARLKASTEYPKKLDKERAELIKKLSPPVEMLRMFDALSLFTYYKDHIRENQNRFHYETRPFLVKVSEALGLKDLQCMELLPWDVIKLLKEGKKFEGDLTGYQNYALIYDGKFNVVVGEEALKIHEAAAASETSEKEIKGVAASVGKVRGYVKLVFRPRHYLGEKDIVLVAPMTNPDLVPALRNAVAVVTDEGGITCHAAIVSRELGIPCVVGTKNATKILKDGDLVEVDADNGIVKILK